MKWSHQTHIATWKSGSHCPLPDSPSLQIVEFNSWFVRHHSTGYPRVVSWAGYVFNAQRACTVLYCHPWIVWLYYIFPHYLKNSMICPRWSSRRTDRGTCRKRDRHDESYSRFSQNCEKRMHSYSNEMYAFQCMWQ